MLKKEKAQSAQRKNLQGYASTNDLMTEETKKGRKVFT